MKTDVITRICVLAGVMALMLTGCSPEEKAQTQPEGDSMGQGMQSLENIQLPTDTEVEQEASGLDALKSQDLKAIDEEAPSGLDPLQAGEAKPAEEAPAAAPDSAAPTPTEQPAPPEQGAPNETPPAEPPAASGAEQAADQTAATQSWRGGGLGLGASIPVDLASVEAGCAMCLYKMEGVEDCALAVKIGDTPYLVKGVEFDTHAAGLCKAVGHAKIKGDITDPTTVVASLFELAREEAAAETGKDESGQ